MTDVSEGDVERALARLAQASPGGGGLHACYVDDQGGLRDGAGDRVEATVDGHDPVFVVLPGREDLPG